MYSFQRDEKEEVASLAIGQFFDKLWDQPHLLKEKFSQKLKYSYYLLNPMAMKSPVKFRSPQHISEASQQNNVAASSLTNEVAMDI